MEERTVVRRASLETASVKSDCFGWLFLEGCEPCLSGCNYSAWCARLTAGVLPQARRDDLGEKSCISCRHHDSHYGGNAYAIGSNCGFCTQGSNWEDRRTVLRKVYVIKRPILPETTDEELVEAAKKVAVDYSSITFESALLELKYLRNSYREISSFVEFAR